MSPLGHPCQHGAMTPSARQLAYHYAAMRIQDQGAAVESCIDWCEICTGIIRREQFDIGHTRQEKADG